MTDKTKPKKTKTVVAYSSVFEGWVDLRAGTSPIFHSRPFDFQLSTVNLFRHVVPSGKL
jgi:hypothetical protein